MIGEHGTEGHAGSPEDKDSPQMSLFEGGGDDQPRPRVPDQVSGLCPVKTAGSLGLAREPQEPSRLGLSHELWR